MKAVIFERDTWDEVYAAISKNKFRALLTMIGVGWGMFLFVVLLGLARGMRNGFDRDLKGVATNSMFLWAAKASIPYEGFQRGRKLQLKMSDMNALKENLPEINLIAPRGRRMTSMHYGTQSGTYSIFGDQPEINKMFNKNITQGRFINEQDIQQKRNVCVIGKEIQEELYSKGENALGTFIKINNVYFRVVGIYKVRADGSFEGENSCFIPFNTFQQLFNMGNKIDWMAINVKNQYDIKQVETKIKTFLKQRKGVSPDDSQAFGSFNLGEGMAKIIGFMSGMQLLTVVVGALTLFAGALAISSILLITVKERTKEFGIRRALGARPGQIRSQIIIESVLLASVAGVSGVTIATVALYLINKFVIPSLSNNIPFYNVTINPSTLGLALIVMIFMAVAAGLLPAQRAVSIKPIDALRDE